MFDVYRFQELKNYIRDRRDAVAKADAEQPVKKKSQKGFK